LTRAGARSSAFSTFAHNGTFQNERVDSPALFYNGFFIFTYKSWMIHDLNLVRYHDYNPGLQRPTVRKNKQDARACETHSVAERVAWFLPKQYFNEYYA
jgi:hypothetical protein